METSASFEARSAPLPYPTLAGGKRELSHHAGAPVRWRDGADFGRENPGFSGRRTEQMKRCPSPHCPRWIGRWLVGRKQIIDGLIPNPRRAGIGGISGSIRNSDSKMGHSAISNRKSAMFFSLPSAYWSMRGSLAPECSGAPLHPFRCLLVSHSPQFAIRHSQSLLPVSPNTRSSFASPAVYGNMRAMCYEAPLLPSRTEARWPGRSCEREGRRLPGLSPWSTRQ